MLQARSVLHTVWLLSLSLTQHSRAHYRQHLTAANTREKVKVTLALLLVFNGQVIFFVVRLLYSMHHQVLHNHNHLPHKRTWNSNSQSNINNKHKQNSQLFKIIEKWIQGQKMYMTECSFLFIMDFFLSVLIWSDNWGGELTEMSFSQHTCTWKIFMCKKYTRNSHAHI